MFAILYVLFLVSALAVLAGALALLLGRKRPWALHCFLLGGAYILGWLAYLTRGSAVGGVAPWAVASSASFVLLWAINARDGFRGL